jgi:hypothetical protein
MLNLCEAIYDLLDNICGLRWRLGTVNVRDLASEITESLADLIVCSAQPEERPRLITHVVAELGRFVREKREAGAGVRCNRPLPPTIR